MIPVDLLKPSGGHEPATMDRPLDHLLACHVRIEEKLAVLERATGHLDDLTEEVLYAFCSVITFLDSSLVLHTEDEEESVFPRIRVGAPAEELEYLDSLEMQHREAEGYVARLKNLVKQLERDSSLASVRAALGQTALRLTALYRAHIASENVRLTAIGRIRLDEVALAEIAFEMKLRRSRGI